MAWRRFALKYYSLCPLEGKSRSKKWIELQGQCLLASFASDSDWTMAASGLPPVNGHSQDRRACLKGAKLTSDSYSITSSARASSDSETTSPISLQRCEDRELELGGLIERNVSGFRAPQD